MGFVAIGCEPGIFKTLDGWAFGRNKTIRAHRRPKKCCQRKPASRSTFSSCGSGLCQADWQKVISHLSLHPLKALRVARCCELELGTSRASTTFTACRLPLCKSHVKPSLWSLACCPRFVARRWEASYLCTAICEFWVPIAAR